MNDKNHTFNMLNRYGILGEGKYRGCYILVEKDKSNSGFHIWVFKSDPRSNASTDGWDIWADNEEQLNEWLNSDFKSVKWFD